MLGPALTHKLGATAHDVPSNGLASFRFLDRTEFGDRATQARPQDVRDVELMPGDALRVGLDVEHPQQ